MAKDIYPAELMAADFVDLLTTAQTKLTVLISGGSVLAALASAFHTLALLDRSWQDITIGLIDERYYPDINSTDTNFAQLQALPAVAKLTQAGIIFRPILVAGASLEQTANLHSEYLADLFSQHGMQVLGIFGAGGDLHTAGILPHHAESEYIFHEQLAVGYRVNDASDSADAHRERITISFPGIHKLLHRWLFITGEQKREVLDVVSGDGVSPLPLNQAPVSYLRQFSDLQVFTDIRRLN